MHRLLDGEAAHAARLLKHLRRLQLATARALCYRDLPAGQARWLGGVHDELTALLHTAGTPPSRAWACLAAEKLDGLRAAGETLLPTDHDPRPGRTQRKRA